MSFCELLPIVLALGLIPPAQSKPETSPVDFKLVVRYFHAGADPIGVGEIVAFKGRAYQFTTELDEFAFIDFAAAHVELINVKHHVQTRLTFAKLDDALTAQRKRLERTIEELEKQEGRAYRISVKKTRELVEPNFRVRFDEKAGRLQLTNETVEVDCTGVADANPARLNFIADAMDVLVKLGAARDPKALPPFTRLETTDLLIRQKKLMPTEFNFLYRLNGPPERKRWTYRLIPELKDRDFIGLARLDRCRAQFKVVSFSDYEKHLPD
jgi:hypothetical protein